MYIKRVKPFEKIVAIVVALVMLISCLVGPGAVVANLTDYAVWTGETVAPTKGSGTVSDPYLIETAEEFAHMMLVAHGGAAYDKGATYKLMNDIYLNDLSKVNWQTGEIDEGYKPNSWTPTYFSGIIYGNGHMVYGMYIDKNPAAYEEKWGETTGAALISENWSNKWIDIYDMGMDYVYVNSPNVSAVYIAGMNSANGSGSAAPLFAIKGCYIGSNVTVKGFAAGGFIGGGYGTKIRAVISNCASLATNFYDNNRKKIGGITGDIWTTTDDKIDNCYSVTSICGNNPPTGSFTNNYATYRSGGDDTTNVRSLSNMQGIDALTNTEKMPGLQEGFFATPTFPVPAALYDALVSADIETGKVWNGTTMAPVKGDGTAENPLQIATAEQLAYAVSTGGNGKHYQLVADIYLNDPDKVNWTTGEPAEGYTPNDWYVGTVFSGAIDGNGHKVYGLYKNSSDEKLWGWNDCALIPRVNYGNSATVKNIGIESAYINNGQAASAIYGGVNGLAVAENCYVGSDVTLCGYETGAIVGLADGTFKLTNCYSFATLKQGIEGNSACDTGLVGEFYAYEGSTTSRDSYLRYCYNANGGGSTKGVPGEVSYVYTTVASKFGSVLTAQQMQGTVFDGNRMALNDSFIATKTYPVLKIFAETVPEYWNGLAHGYDGGNGESSATAYKISNPGQLAYMVAVGGIGKYYELTDDIYLNELEKIDWTTGEVKGGVNYTPNFWFTGTDSSGTKYNGFNSNIKFSGTLDGNGHTVFGFLNKNGTKATTGGLIPAAESTTVSDLRLSWSYVTSGRFTGGLASFYGGTVSGVVVDETVTVCGQKADSTLESTSLGGVIGFSDQITMSDCAFVGTISHTATLNHIYGLIGTSWCAKINMTNCFTVGYQPVTASHGLKNFASLDEAKAYYSNLYKASGVYTDNVINQSKVSFTVNQGATQSLATFTFSRIGADDMLGANALAKMSALSSDKWYAVDGEYPYNRAWASAHGDADSDGVFLTDADIIAVRNTIMGYASHKNSDLNQSGKTDICDLVGIIIEEDPTYFENGVEYELIPWNGPEGYSIQYPENYADIYDAAVQLQEMYADLGVEVSVINDKITPNKTIILKISEDLGVSEYKTDVNKSQIIITAGGKNALLCAVDIFVKYSVEGKFALVRGTSDYTETITLSSGNTYNYVWSDEFYGNTLDTSKWVCDVNRSKMSGFADLKLLDDEQAVQVKDGNLRLIAQEYTDPNNGKIKYAVPASVHSQGTMEYRYGYAEIRAKVPFSQGVWPSFWAQGITILGGRTCYDYGVEVDIFEIFGNANTVVPNIHKWYSKDYNYNELHGGNVESNHTQITKKTSYKYSNYANLSDEYHIYGFEWTPTEMSMYVDGTLYNTFDIVNSYDLCPDMSGFQDPLFIIFNNHLFTDASSYKPNLINGNEGVLPAAYEIDWFRVYQSDEVEGSQIWTIR